MRALLSTATISALLAGLGLLSCVGSVVAQTSDTEYCYGSVCGTQEQAEAAMRAAYPQYAPYFKQKDKSVGFVNGKLVTLYITYTVPDQPAFADEPAAYNASYFANPAPTWCAPSANVRYPTMCASESELISALVASTQASRPTSTVQHSVAGSFADPYFSSSGFGTPPPGQQPYGMKHHALEKTFASGNLKVTINVFNVEGTQTSGWTYDVYKISSYLCRPGFTGISGRHPKYVDGTELAVLDPPNLCQATVADQTITTRLRQSSCPKDVEGNNPCYPATGDKARFETDFEFAGRSFTRSYHSLRQVGQLPELAPGWVHTYSDRISGNPSYLSSPLLWTTDSGYLEIFKRVGSSNRFVANGNANAILDVEPTNTLPHKFILTGAGTQARYFNAAGRLIRIEERGSAWKITFAYNGDRLISATDHLGNELLFDYQNNKLTAIQLPDGQTVQYSYDAQDNFDTVQYAGGTTRSYHYNEAGYSDANDPHSLTGISDNGQRYATFAYDNKNRVRLSQLHGGDGTFVEKTTLAYPSDTQVIVTGHRGETRNYTISSASGYRRVVSVTASDGTRSNTYVGPLTYETYDKNQNVTRYEYAADGSYRNARYDAYGTPQERKTTTARNSLYQVTTEEVQAKSGSTYITKQRRTFTYDTDGNVASVKVEDPALGIARTTAYNYCTQVEMLDGKCPLTRLLTSIDGPRTDVIDKTVYAYYQDSASSCPLGACPYQRGRLKSVTNPLGQKIEYLAYSRYGRVGAIKDQNGVITDFEYDAYGRVTARKRRGTNDTAETDDQITRIEYWPIGQVKKVTQPDGTFTTYTYDSAHRLTGISDNAGNSMSFTLNAASERVKEEIKDANGVLQYQLSLAYNTLGQLQTVTDAYASNTGFTYDLNSNLDTTTDPLARVSDNNYDPLDRLSRTLQDMTGIAAETKFSYDVLDNLTQVNDPKGLNTNYTYNGLGDLTQLNSPDTGTSIYTYDNAGNRKTEKDARNKTTTYSYDALNRLTSVTYAATALNTTYTYDSTQTACVAGETFTVGRLTKVTDGSGNTVYCYDRFGNLVRKVQTANAKVFSLRYTYNVAGQLTSVIYPDGAIADYLYDAQGRVSEVGAKTATGTRQVLLTGTSYYPFGPIAQWTYGNGRLMKRSLNQNYQPGFVEVTTAGGINIGYEFDEVGNLKKLRAANQVDPPKRISGYDGLNRLLDSKDGTTNAVLQAYAYDKTGNRTSATVGTTTTPYTYPAGSHLLSQVGSNTRAYDFNGNTTSIPGTVVKNFVYGDHNRMTQYREGTTVKMNYVYNGHGEQVRKYASGTTNVYSLYDEAGHWLGDYNNAAAATQQVIWLYDLPVGVFVGAAAAQKLHYIEADALGTPRVVVDPTRGAQGTAVWAWDLAGEAFGTTAPNQNPDGDAVQFVFNMRFPGQRYDSVSGMNYNYFRDYDPSTGRYSQSDPIGLDGGISTYGYVGGNPLLYMDPWGLAHWRGTATIAYGSHTAKIKPTKWLPPIAKKKFERARVTLELESDCVKGSKTKVSLVGWIDINSSNPYWLKLGRYDVDLYDHQPGYQPGYQTLQGDFSINASGYWGANGSVSVGGASGKITDGKSMLGDLDGRGVVELVPFTGNTFDSGSISCTCEE